MGVCGWAFDAYLIFAIPLTVIGLMRFVFVKETIDVQEKVSTRANFKDVWIVLKTNPYLRVVAILGFSFSAINSLRAGQYFFEWVMGDISLMSVIGIVGFVALPLMIVLPRILRRFTKRSLVVISSCMYVIGGLTFFLGGVNISISVVLIAGTFNALAAIPISVLADLMLLDIGSFNAYKNGKRMDGTLTSVRNFLSLLGGALAPGLLGILLGLTGYDGALQAQPDSAIFMIRVAMGLVPAVLFSLVAIAFVLFYKLDKLMPKIKQSMDDDIIM